MTMTNTISTTSTMVKDSLTNLKFELVEENTISRITNGEHSVCTAGIYTTLIKEAAKCQNYSSDVLYDIQYIENSLKQIDIIPPSNFYFGFRKLGVDGFEIIRERICLSETFPEDSPKVEDVYFSIYIISLSEEFIRLYKCIDLKGDDK